ncbi:MAG: hypothetical protein BZY75_01505 [SAR202 cluster bacterium Io17-Chloro-G7]|nr:MAG: hypothetical protein BZY75_01505 [SAR202 cluster bacterium Io17-Chloro-G7]
MSRLAPLGRLASKWYISTSIIIGLGIILGSMVFFNVWPGKPKIGMINIPFTVITDRSAFEIASMLEYARVEDSIDAVVITINSPGGGAAASEELFFETAKLREKKPVVVVMNDLVASGGYMMGLGANFIYAKPSSFIGGIGVILSPVPAFIPRPPTERDVLTGPFKAEGGDRRHYVSLTDQLKQAFAQLVSTQRGHLLTKPLSEVTQGQIFSGIEGVRLGLVDAIGGRTDAIEKAASLAGVSGYDMEDINTEVSRIFNEKRQRARGSSGSDEALTKRLNGQGERNGFGLFQEDVDSNLLGTLPLPGGIGEDPNKALPDFPLKINGPNAYYLYVGPSP